MKAVADPSAFKRAKGKGRRSSLALTTMGVSVHDRDVRPSQRAAHASNQLLPRVHDRGGEVVEMARVAGGERGAMGERDAGDHRIAQFHYPALSLVYRHER